MKNDFRLWLFNTKIGKVLSIIMIIIIGAGVVVEIVKKL